MSFYTKKPVTIEARRFLSDTAAEVADWCGGDVIEDDEAEEYNVPLYLDIYTLEGVMRANLGDFIIKGVKGEFYPCKPDIFFETYEAETPLFQNDPDIYAPVEEYDGGVYLNVDDMVDHDDGSCTIGISMDQKSMKKFAEIGILKVLTDEARRVLAENDEFDTNVGC